MSAWGVGGQNDGRRGNGGRVVPLLGQVLARRQWGSRLGRGEKLQQLVAEPAEEDSSAILRMEAISHMNSGGKASRYYCI